MVKYSIEGDKLTAIGNAIREKTGGTSLLTVDEMANAVEEIEAGGDTSMEDAFVTQTITEYSNDRVETVGNYAFYRCSRLTSVDFPAATTIGDNAFYYCSSLTSVSFPAATTIGYSAFTQCSRLTSVSFPAATTIGNYAFSYCYNLATANLPAATTIGTAAFSYCTPLASVSFPAAVTIGNAAFRECSSLTSVSLPAATSIGYGAFWSCHSLTTISLPAATTISNCAFCYCKSLASVSFPAATTIGNYAFSYCKSLASVSFPAATTIGGHAFCECSSLTSLYLTGSSLCTLGNSIAFMSTPIASGAGYIYVPSSLVASYKTATNWTYFSNRISAIEGITDSETGGDNSDDNSNVETIMFTIDGAEFTAEKGSTWLEWLDSTYCDKSIFSLGYETILYQGYPVVGNNGSNVYPDYEIEENGEYQYNWWDSM